jgi:hypothetical protein
MLLSLVQTYALVYSSRHTLHYRMYAPVFSADVRGGTSGCMLIDSTSYSVNSIQMYATLWNTRQIIPEHTRQHLDHCVIVLDIN